MKAAIVGCGLDVEMTKSERYQICLKGFEPGEHPSSNLFRHDLSLPIFSSVDMPIQNPPLSAYSRHTAL
jgi:hypothetical protein